MYYTQDNLRRKKEKTHPKKDLSQELIVAILISIIRVYHETTFLHHVDCHNNCHQFQYMLRAGHADTNARP